MGLMGQRGDEDTVESSDNSDSLDPTSTVKEKQIEDENSANQASEVISGGEEAKEELRNAEVERGSEEEVKDTSGEAKENAASDHSEAEVVSPPLPVETSEQKLEEAQQTESTSNLQEEEEVLQETVQPGSTTDNLQEEKGSEEISSALSESPQSESTGPGGTVGASTSVSTVDDATSLSNSTSDENAKREDAEDVLPAQTQDDSPHGPAESRETYVSDVPVSTIEAVDSSTGNLSGLQYNEMEASKSASDLVTPLKDANADSVEIKQHLEETNVKEQTSSASKSADVADSVAELEKVKKEMNMMEAALHGAARQAQVLKYYEKLLLTREFGLFLGVWKGASPQIGSNAVLAEILNKINLFIQIFLSITFISSCSSLNLCLESEKIAYEYAYQQSCICLLFYVSESCTLKR